MLSLKLTTVLLTTVLATSTQALYFRLSPFTTTSTYSPTESHTVTFTINNPDAVFEQGGSYARTCNITWTGCTPPPCWTSCNDDGLSPAYYARVLPSSSSNNKFSPEAFTLEVEEYYVYRSSARNNATIYISEGENGYACSRAEEQSTTCGFAEGTTSDLTATYSVPSRDNVCAY
ncbi:hypothetical protein CKM354_000217000 [Cercospora kikuchii]|uniref:Uncharacterized protein n=1 Tax=Cercospora kikuchii TaxID=84275 RepID=A0A9P3CBZ4_9PEZI|nr:uncharacterized protein CKM354_000217000 [Cercospora kikuchii]GIZ38766.1 hypothetical protein CKM354_000217000 [Cercospora kikuchii]